MSFRDRIFRVGTVAFFVVLTLSLRLPVSFFATLAMSPFILNGVFEKIEA